MRMFGISHHGHCKRLFRLIRKGMVLLKDEVQHVSDRTFQKYMWIIRILPFAFLINHVGCSEQILKHGGQRCQSSVADIFMSMAIKFLTFLCNTSQVGAQGLKRTAR